MRTVLVSCDSPASMPPAAKAALFRRFPDAPDLEVIYTKVINGVRLCCHAEVWHRTGIDRSPRPDGWA